VKLAKLLAGKDSFLLDQTLLSERVGDGPQVTIKPFCYFFIIIRVAEFPKNIIITDLKVIICNQVFSKQPLCGPNI
jgi:hypothetical protein